MKRLLGMVALAALLHGCTSGPQPNAAFTVTSDDGSATLEVPSGALPQGVSSSAITLTRLDPSTAAILPGHAFVQGWSLEPDGTVLSAPATLRFRMQPQAGYATTFIHESSEQVVGITPELGEPEADGSRDVALPVPHFSKSRLEKIDVTDPNSVIHATVQSQDTLVKAGTFGALTMRVDIGPRTIGDCDTRISALATRSGTWTGGSILDPNSTTYGAAFPEGQAFTCLQEGKFQVRAQVGLNFLRKYYCFDIYPQQPDTVGWAYTIDVASAEHTCLNPMIEGLDDWLSSRSNETPTFQSLISQIVGYGAERFDPNKTTVDNAFNFSIFECGETNAEGFTTVCPTGVQPFPEGPAYVVMTRLAAPLPAAGADENHHFIYGLVAESDGVAANDWVFVPPFDWDFFRDTDRWYQLIWNPNTDSWKLTVTQVDSSQNQNPGTSAVRAVLKDDTITWYVPVSEFPGPAPAYRVTAFGHDGMFSVSDRGGDVSGVDPTQPLTPFPPAP